MDPVPGGPESPRLGAGTSDLIDHLPCPTEKDWLAVVGPGVPAAGEGARAPKARDGARLPNPQRLLVQLHLFNFTF